MITRTIRETLQEAIFYDCVITPGYVYVVRDNDVIFYVGISKDPIFRLCQHLGIADGWGAYTYPPDKLIQDMEERKPRMSYAGSQVGDCILNNAPESLEWQFDIYEQEDAIAVVKRTDLPAAFPRLLELMEIDWYNQKEIVENALIDELKPCLNVIDSAHRRNIPAKYKSGLNSNESSSLALDL